MRACLLLLLLLCVSPAVAQSIAWKPVAKPWNREWGSHRIIVKVTDSAEAVHAHLPWRRRDVNPAAKAVWVYDLKTNQPIANVLAKNITNEAGDVYFQPTQGAGEYAIYFLLVKIGGGAFPVGKYQAPEDKAEAGWKAKALTTTVKAEPVRWEAISAYDGWNEMEVIATAEEEAALAKTIAAQSFYSRIESREHPVRMFDRLPERWIRDAEQTVLQAQPGEYLAFQAVVWVPKNFGQVAIDSVTLSELKSEEGKSITLPARDITFEPRGLNSDPTEQVLRSQVIQPGTVQPLWAGITVPVTAKPGTYAGKLTIKTMGSTPGGRDLRIIIVVAGEPWKESLNVDAKKLNRLQWLDSKEAVDHEPVKGYEPIKLDEAKRELNILGRTLVLAPNGLPEQITSHFNKAVTKVAAESKLNLLTGPFAFRTGLTAAGPTPEKLQFHTRAPGFVEWRVLSDEGNVTTMLTGSLSSDGNLQCRIAVTAKEDVVLPDVRLTIPRTPESCEYVIGMGQAAGLAKPAWDWQWDVANKHQDSVWLGAVNGGLRIQLMDDQYHRPPVNIHYKRNPLVLPSWGNDGQGKVTFANNTLTVILGERKLGKRNEREPSDALVCSFNLLITPFHPLRTEEQWSERYYHTHSVPADSAKYLDSAKAAGANLVNIHQGNSLNPYINYPFLTADRLKVFTDLAHQRDMRVKFYYTVRELSNWAPELFAIRSMGDSILPHGKGGGHPWLEEHLGGDYWGAWYEPGVQDVSVLTKPTGKWLNYYVEGLKWLVEQTGCDGLYLDDISYDRETMERCRKVLDRYNPRGGRTDLHSWNEFHGGGAWAQCANIFMDSMPFIDRLWFGEGHHYTGPPADHFLVELSGVPYGLMGEMLEGGGNPWLGLVNGCTGRLGWGGNPRPVWKLWDDFDVKGSEFIGWWAKDECPVQTDNANVKATVWKQSGRTLVALGNFSEKSVTTKLRIDWKKLGLDPAKAKFYAPSMTDLGPREAIYNTDQPLAVKAHKGMALIIDEKSREIAAAPAADALGKLLLDETFKPAPQAAWKVVASPKAIAGVPANVHAYLERPVEATAGAVALRVYQDGKDDAQQWGPGMALIWPNGNTLKVSLRKDDRITVSSNGNEQMPASITTRAPLELTVRWNDKQLSVQAGGPAMGDLSEEIATFPRAQFPGVPGMVRIGKMPNTAGPTDHGDAGPVGFSRLEWFRIHER
jgi:hypothetical protein